MYMYFVCTMMNLPIYRCTICVTKYSDNPTRSMAMLYDIVTSLFYGCMYLLYEKDNSTI